MPVSLRERSGSISQGRRIVLLISRKQSYANSTQLDYIVSPGTSICGLFMNSRRDLCT